MGKMPQRIIIYLVIFCIALLNSQQSIYANGKSVNLKSEYLLHTSKNINDIKLVSWEWPVKYPELSDWFYTSWSTSSNNWRGYHAALDIVSNPAKHCTKDSTNMPKADKSIYAAADGKVVYVYGKCTSKSSSGCGNGWGNNIVIRHKVNGKVVAYSQYSHLSSVEPKIKKDKSVKQGEKIGVMGDTGQVTGIHLDFMIGDLNSFSGSMIKHQVTSVMIDPIKVLPELPKKPTKCGITAKVTKVELNKASTTLEVGKTETLKATVSPSNATNKDVTWTSADKNIASVTSAGKVTGVKAGTIKITVTTKDGNKTAECTVTVKAAPANDDSTIKVTKVELNKSTTTIEAGKTETLKATVSPSNATNKDVTWSSADKNIASVTSTGKVTGVKAGKTKITVTTKDGNKTAECSVTVNEPTPSDNSYVGVKKVELNKTTATITIGNTVKLKPTITPSNATDKGVTWKSSKTSIATVETDGTVTGKKVGKTVITVTTNDGNKTAECTVTVKLAKPKDLTATKVNSYTIKVSWSKVDGASTYEAQIKRKDVDVWVSDDWNTGLFNKKNTSVTLDELLKSPYVYYYRVRAVDSSDNKSAWTDPIEIILK